MPDANKSGAGSGSDAEIERDPLLSEAAERAATDRIAWAMLVVSGEPSPRKEWAEHADVWREKADGVWGAALRAARNA